MSKKYVVQIDVRGSNAPLDSIQSELPAPTTNDKVWEDEHSETRDTDEDGTPFLSAHIPYDEKVGADNLFSTLKGLNGVINQANQGSYIHVHECATSGGPDAWDCGDRISDELTP